MTSARLEPCSGSVAVPAARQAAQDNSLPLFFATLTSLSANKAITDLSMTKGDFIDSICVNEAALHVANFHRSNFVLRWTHYIVIDLSTSKENNFQDLFFPLLIVLCHAASLNLLCRNTMNHTQAWISTRPWPFIQTLPLFLFMVTSS